MSFIRKKKNSLQGSNLSQQEFLRRTKELLNAEQEETTDVKESILSRLATSRIKGFETRDELKENLIKNAEISDPLSIEFDENELDEYKRMQIELLEKLLEERMFVNPDLKLNNGITKYKDNLDQIEVQDKGKSEAISGEKEKKKDEKGKKILMYRKLEDGEISEKDGINERLKIVFENLDQFLKLRPDDVFAMNKYEKSNLLELKSDYLYIDEKFQQYQFEKYASLMKEVEVGFNF